MPMSFLIFFKNLCIHRDVPRQKMFASGDDRSSRASRTERVRDPAAAQLKALCGLPRKTTHLQGQ
jgi:hypothetical protein